MSFHPPGFFIIIIIICFYYGRYGRSKYAEDRSARRVFRHDYYD